MAKGKRFYTPGSVLLILIIWKAASLLVGREIILPSPEGTFLYTLELLGTPQVWAALGATVRRTLVSFALNLILALIMGMAAGFLEPLELFLNPLITLLRSVPTMGVILLSLIWFGSELAAIFVCSLIVFPLLYQAALGGVKSRDPRLAEMNRVFAVPPLRRLLHFYLPTVKPHLVTGIVSALGLSIKIMISAEVLSQPRAGIGTMFQVERARLNTEGVFAWSLLVILITAGLDQLLKLLNRKYSLDHK